MTGGVLVAPSILSANFSRLGEQVRAVDAAGAEWIHPDVMDGHFVPNITFGPDVVRVIRPCSRKCFDAHLMIAPTDAYLEAFAKAGPTGSPSTPRRAGSSTARCKRSARWGKPPAWR